MESLETPTLKVEFSIEYVSTLGNNVYVVGSIPALGSWNPSSAVKMNWNKAILF